LFDKNFLYFLYNGACPEKRPALSSKGKFQTVLAGTDGPEILEGINACGVAVGPLEADPVIPHRACRKRPDRLRNFFREKPLAACPLIDAGGTTAFSSEIGKGVKRPVAILPFDIKLFILDCANLHRPDCFRR